MNNRYLILFLLLALFLFSGNTENAFAVTTTGSPSPATTTPTQSPSLTPTKPAFDPTFDQAVSSLFSQINLLREENEAGMLILDNNLTAAAQNFAEYLLESGKLSEKGPQGETVTTRAKDVGYGGGTDFTVTQNSAMVWADTTMEYLVRAVWGGDIKEKLKLINPKSQHIGIGIAEHQRRRFVVVMTGHLSDGSVRYTPLPTYDERTPRPVLSLTPSPVPLVTSTQLANGAIYHEIGGGQTLSEIAQAYGIDWYALAQRNQLDPEDPVIYEGELLVIQPSFTITPTPTETNTPRPPTKTPRPTFTNPPMTSETAPAFTRTAVPQITEQNFLSHFLARLGSFRAQAGFVLALLSGIGLILSVLLRKK